MSRDELPPEMTDAPWPGFEQVENEVLIPMERTMVRIRPEHLPSGYLTCTRHAIYWHACHGQRCPLCTLIDAQIELEHLGRMSREQSERHLESHRRAMRAAAESRSAIRQTRRILSSVPRDGHEESG